MPVTPEDVRALSLTGEFDHDPPYSGGAIQLRIDRAALFVDTDFWGDRADPAIANLAAHFLVMESTGGQSSTGAVVSEKVGEVQVNYAAPATASGSEANFSTTAYGRNFLELAKIVNVGTSSVWSKTDLGI